MESIMQIMNWFQINGQIIFNIIASLVLAASYIVKIKWVVVYGVAIK